MNYETEVEDFLNTGGASLTFDEIDTQHTGQVIAAAVVDDQYNEPDGKILRIDLDIDGETRSLWVRSIGMRKAIRKACETHNLKAPRPGGTLTVKYTGDGTPSQKGFNAPKQYAATYKPADSVVAEDVLTDNLDTELI